MKPRETSISTQQLSQGPPFPPEAELIHWKPPPSDPGTPNHESQATPSDDAFTSSLPTIFIDPSSERILPTTSHIQTFLHSDLSFTKLDRAYRHLWWAGRQFPARPLHRQVHELGRAVALTSRADLHLVWCPRTRRLFVKPLPAYLLSHACWARRLSGGGGGGGADGELEASARGFLLSYIWLVRDELDWAVARDARLLPDGVSWVAWRGFVEAVVRGGGLDVNGLVGVHRRFHYGELRVNRLDHLYRFGYRLDGQQLLRGYGGLLSPSYSDFFRKRFGWIIIAFAFCNTVLSALQVGLAADPLRPSKALQDVSSGIVVLSLVVLAVTVVVIFVLYFGLFLFFLVKTLRNTAAREQKRKIWMGGTRSESSI
ncbi:uncharacterized protein B0H64DRAFT_473857 [Chaetomium fimeti]|uniref:Uncharacterized protein n=1 Tax=Chaetomium fimeti TaxID=1854472 RepID=A0AAE0LUB7_9PEZI|nr:hypothetical protein B0H64DRAFT_473857 [Chaetomium fimeti]